MCRIYREYKGEFIPTSYIGSYELLRKIIKKH